MSITVTECTSAAEVKELARRVAEKRRAGYATVKAAFHHLDLERPPVSDSFAKKAMRELQEQLKEQRKLNVDLAIKIEELMARNRWLATEIKACERRTSRPIAEEDIPKKTVLNFSVLLRIVSFKSDLSPQVLVAQRRHKTVTHWRQILMYLAHNLTGYSYPQIGRLTGGRDHTTVLHAVRKITAMREAEPDIDAIITELEREIQGLFP
jgi:hypothetical protein